MRIGSTVKSGFGLLKKKSIIVFYETSMETYVGIAIMKKLEGLIERTYENLNRRPRQQ
jgi:hypothetical protein